MAGKTGRPTMKIQKKTLTTILLLSVLPAMAMAQNHTADATLPLDPAVRTGKLPNGFTYYIRHNEEPKDRVLLYLVNKAGSVLEDADQRGLAHVLEHMAFNGTEHFPQNTLIDYLQKSGVRFGADLNAYTGYDETVYQLPIPSNDNKILLNGLQIMRDWAQSMMLDTDKLKKEVKVVLEEKRLKKGAGDRMRRAYLPFILNHSRYSSRAPIGNDTVLETFKPEVLLRFYQDWYRPDLQALVMVGDIDVDLMERIIKEHFADLRNPNPEKPRPIFEIPLVGRDQFIKVTDPEMPATVARIIFKHLKVPVQTESGYRKSIVKALFNRMISGRYNELAKNDNSPFVDCGAQISDLISGLDGYSVNMTVKRGEIENAVKLAWRETERVRRFGFTQTELDRAKKAFLSQLKRVEAEKNKTSSINYADEYKENFLRGEAAPGISKEVDLATKDLPHISLTDFNFLLTEYTSHHNRDILIMAPEQDKSLLPDETKFNRWLAIVSHEKILPYQDEISRRPLIEEKLIPGTIVSRVTDKRLGTVTMFLSNGLKIVLKPTEFKNDEVLFSAFSSGGTSLYVDSVYQSAASAASIVTAGGAGNYNSTELNKFMEGKQVSVRPFIDDLYSGINGSFAPDDIESALLLIHADFTAPRKDTSAFRSIIDRTKASISNRENDPNTVFDDTVSAVLSGNQPRYTGMNLQKLKQVKLDQAFSIYKECFADASNYTFVFTGNIDTAAVTPLLLRYLGSLPASYKHDRFKDLGIHIPPGKSAHTVYKGTEAKASVLLVYSGPYLFNQSNNIKMDALQECLEIRLIERLRQTENGVYNPSVFINKSKQPAERCAIFIEFGCSPDNAEKLIASVNDEIVKLKANGPVHENLDKWRSEDRATRETQLKTNLYWLTYLRNRLQNGVDFDQIDLHNKIRDQLKVSDVKDIAEKYLSGENYIRMVLLPESFKQTMN